MGACKAGIWKFKDYVFKKNSRGYYSVPPYMQGLKYFIRGEEVCKNTVERTCKTVGYRKVCTNKTTKKCNYDASAGACVKITTEHAETGTYLKKFYSSHHAIDHYFTCCCRTGQWYGSIGVKGCSKSPKERDSLKEDRTWRHTVTEG